MAKSGASDALKNSTRRQLALMILFGERTKLTAEQAAKAIPYYELQGLKNPVDSAAKDLKELRAMGCPIVHVGEEWVYDDTQFIPVDMEGSDPNLLRAVIFAGIGRGADQQGSPAGHRGLLHVMSALNKLNSNVTTVFNARIEQMRAPLPEDAALFAVVEAIEAHKQIVFDYESTSSPEPSRRILAPMALFANQGNQYVSGISWKAEETHGQGAWRNFRISRMSNIAVCDQPDDERQLTEEEMAEATAIAQERTYDFFIAHRAYFALRPGTCEPIRALGDPIELEELGSDAARVPDGWDCVRLNHIDRLFLLNKLATYGSDLRLIGPDDVRKDYIERLTHLGAIV